jgi:transcriptional regulator with XRE-family HTH domain
MRYGMITGAQIRAARALLGWTATDLAEKSGVSYASIQRAEAVNGVSTMRAKNLYALQRALEDGGVIFLGASDNGGDGLRLKCELS